MKLDKITAKIEATFPTENEQNVARRITTVIFSSSLKIGDDIRYLLNNILTKVKKRDLEIDIFEEDIKLCKKNISFKIKLTKFLRECIDQELYKDEQEVMLLPQREQKETTEDDQILAENFPEFVNFVQSCLQKTVEICNSKILVISDSDVKNIATQFVVQFFALQKGERVSCNMALGQFTIGEVLEYIDSRNSRGTVNKFRTNFAALLEERGVLCKKQIGRVAKFFINPKFSVPDLHAAE